MEEKQNTKLKVLIVAFNNLGKGGIQNQIYLIVKNLHSSVDFTIVVWDDDKSYYEEELKQYATIIKCFRQKGMGKCRRKLDAFIRYRDIENIIKEIINNYGPFDAIHCNNAFDAAPCLVAARECGVPIRISHAHNVENPLLKKKKIYLLYRLLYEQQRRIIRKNATKMIACSRQVADYFFGKGYGEVVNIGVDIDCFNRNKSTPPRETIELLHVGNMSYQKNQLFLLDAIKEIVQIRSNVHLSMIGEGTEYYQKVKQRIIELQLQEHVTLFPANTDVKEAMKNSDVFLLPSTFEGFGIVLIEAQASGLNCIVSDVVPKEADCGGVTFLSLSLGTKEWAKNILQVIDSKRSVVPADVSDFSVENMTRRIHEIYGSKS